MPGLGAKLKLGAGWAGSDQGYQSPVTQTMYGQTGAGAGGAAGTHVITGELLALVVLELILLGWIRLSFRHHFGG